jgi:hypothetical protein
MKFCACALVIAAIDSMVKRCAKSGLIPAMVLLFIACMIGTPNWMLGSELLTAASCNQVTDGIWATVGKDCTCFALPIDAKYLKLTMLLATQLRTCEIFQRLIKLSSH